MSRTGTFEVVNRYEFPDDRFVSDEFRLPSLQKMAAYRLSLIIWYNFISSEKSNASVQKNRTFYYCYDLMRFGRSNHIDRMKSHYKRFNELVTASFSTQPKFVREILTECFHEILKNIYSWMHWSVDCLKIRDFRNYHFKDVDPNHCVWYQNGKIDYRRSAMNILISPGLNAEQRFALVSKYCMEDEIKTFSLHSLNPDFIEMVNFNNDPVMYYWICYLKNTLHEIPTLNFNSIDVAMTVIIVENKIDDRIYWTAFQYFWNRLGFEDQILVTKLRLNLARKNFKRSGYACVNEYTVYNVEERLFSMLSWNQQRRFIYPTLDESILYFCTRLDSPEVTFWAWNICKDLLSLEQFTNIVDLILRKGVEHENVMILFRRLWNTVPTHYRTYVLKMKENEMVDYFFYKRTLSPSSVKFLSEFLMLKSSDFRKEFMLNNAGRICDSNQDPYSLTELINFCLPNQTDQMEFKSLIFNSEYFKEKCFSLFLFGGENLFKSTLEYFALNMYDVINFKKWILESDLLKNDMFNFMYNVDRWNKLSNVIDEIYPNDQSLALKAKKQIVLSFPAYRFPFGLISPSADLEKFATIIEQLRFTDEEKETFKQICLNYFKETLYQSSTMPASYSYESIEKFTIWCLGNDKEAILSFKNSISLNTVFNNFFDDLPRIYTTDPYYFQPILSQFNDCLRWYFSSVQEIRRFKINKINNCDIQILNIFLEQNDELFLEQLLRWFFENDEAKILEFKLRRSYKK